jgi:hypothetical protein
MKPVAAALVVIGALALPGCGADAPATSGGTAAPPSPPPPPGAIGVGEYPLDTCVVSGEKLGSMGEVVKVVHDGTEVRFCCAKCVEEFNKNPGPFVGKVKAAAARPR